jgi:hypothetical protein
MQENYNWINSREVLNPKPLPKIEKKIDIPLSKALGRNIVMGTSNHRRAIHLINKWNMSRGEDDLRSIDYLRDPKKVEELRRAVS